MASERTTKAGLSPEELQMDGAVGEDELLHDPNLAMKQAMLYAKDLARVYGEEQARTAELEQACKQLKNQVRERENIEQALRESQDRYKQLTENSLTGVYIHENEILVYVNSRLAAMFGYSPEEMIGRNFWDFVHPDDRSTIREQFLCVSDGGDTPIEYEFRHLCKNGTVRWVQVLASTIKHGGKVTHMGNMLDITERRRAEEEVMRTRAFLDSVIENLPTAVFLKDAAELRFVVCNKACEDLYGRSRDELLGKTVHDIFPEAEADFLDREDRDVLRDGRLRNIPEQRIKTKSNDERIVHKKKLPLLDENGKPKYLVCIAEDITEAVQISEQLNEARHMAEEANRAKSEFLANMSHEIRTPMNGILGMTELALNTELTPEQHEYLEGVKSSAEALLTIINDILDLSKIEARKLELVAVDFNLRDCIADMMVPLALAAEKRGLELVYHVPAAIPEALVGDPGRLRQVLVNLIANSIKFTNKGEVRLEVNLESETHSEALLQFCVTDTGIGIPQEKQGKVFEAFEQVDGSFNREHGGTGLGLTITNRLVQMMGGQIQVESELGRGSRFCFKIPLARQKEQRLAPPPKDTSRLKGLRVLIVDDSATNRRILEETVANWGMEPNVAADGFEALASLKHAYSEKRPFSAALIDYIMPGMDGFELAERIKKDSYGRGLAMIMLTSAGRRGDAARCLNLGISAYLPKPVRSADLMDALNKAVHEPGSNEPSANLVTQHSIRESNRRLRILLVEDNVINQKVASSMLQKMRHSVLVAGDGNKAIEALSQEHFDMVFMDVQMPEMDGLEATRVIRQREKLDGTYVPIIAMTAAALKGDKEKCFQVGMDAYIAKPLDVRELFRTVERFTPEAPETQMHSEESTQRQNVFDLVQLLERVQGDKPLLNELIALFLDECPGLLSEMHKALQAQNAEGLARSAHTLKGCVGNFCAPQAVQAALELELIGRRRDLAHADEALARVTVETDRLRQGLMSLTREAAQ